MRYLHLLSYSDIFLFYLLMTSAKFGVERDAGLKEDIDLFPFIPFESLALQRAARVLTEPERVGAKALPRPLMFGSAMEERYAAASPDEYAIYRRTRAADALEDRLEAVQRYIARYPEGAWAPEVNAFFESLSISST